MGDEACAFAVTVSESKATAIMFDPSQRDRLITDWIVMHHAEADSAEYEQHRWADVRLSELVRTDPHLGLELIMSILSRDASNRVIANLAAGPLEDLLSEHGNDVIGEVERIARDDAAFKTLLGGVWQGEMSDEVWERVRTVAGTAW